MYISIIEKKFMLIVLAASGPGPAVPEGDRIKN